MRLKKPPLPKGWDTVKEIDKNRRTTTPFYELQRPPLAKFQRQLLGVKRRKNKIKPTLPKLSWDK
jgi:hypothetical protein